MHFWILKTEIPKSRLKLTRRISGVVGREEEGRCGGKKEQTSEIQRRTKEKTEQLKKTRFKEEQRNNTEKNEIKTEQTEKMRVENKTR